MTSADNLAAIASEGERLLEFAKRDPARAVPHYPDWSMRDLVSHTASVHARTAFICDALPQESLSPVPLPEGRDPLDWYVETLAAMLQALRSADPDAEAWSLFPDRRLRTWQRRMVIETGVHRWDAQQATEDPDPLLPIVAAHGLEEFADLWLPRLGSISTLEVTATDIGRSWTFGAGDPGATTRGSASDLYLRLMARPGAQLPAEWGAAVDSVPTPAG